MLFNSLEFIFVFLPLVLGGFYFLSHRELHRLITPWLLVASLFFYAYWDLRFVPLMIFSILINYGFSRLITRQTKKAQTYFIAGIVFNLGLLIFYKYSTFSSVAVSHIVLPLAISFYTFQQISYLADCRQLKQVPYSLLNYGLFVTFFPQLIAGPILHHHEFMPQVLDEKKRKWQSDNFVMGLNLFALGLFKKVIIADQLAIFANVGFENVQMLGWLDAWLASISYSFQLYFDFCGYSEMALGLALFFNINIPLNFRNPYRARTIQEFWAGWHMTLTRWFQDYLYYPLALQFLRSHTSRFYQYLPHLIVFILIGVWHGSGWTFMVFGALHGVALLIHQEWRRQKWRLPALIAWILTFSFVNLTWVFFRAPDLSTALSMVKAMMGLRGPSMGTALADFMSRINLDPLMSPASTNSFATLRTVVIILFALWIALKWEDGKSSLSVIRGAMLFGLSLFAMTIMQQSEFLYFNF